MKAYNYLLLAISFLILSCSPQYSIKEPTKVPVEKSIDEKRIIQNGIRAHDRGDYDDAVSLYQEVLSSNPDNAHALYELALTYSAMDKHRQSLETGLRAMEYQWPELNRVYSLIGTELDLLGKKSDAIDVYEKGIKRYPDDFNLYYNLGIARLSEEEIEEAKKAFKKSVILNPLHASSHLGLAESLFKEDNKIPALFAYCRFLILEPSSERAESARRNVLSISAGDIKANKKNPNQIAVSVEPDDPKSEGNFQTLSFYISANSALQLMMTKDNRSARDKKIGLFDDLFSTAGKNVFEENKSKFIWQYYVPYFAELSERKFSAAFVDYSILDLKETTDTTKMFLKWSEDYKWPVLPN